MGGLGLPTDDKHSFVPEPVAAATVRDLLQLPEDTQSIRYEGEGDLKSQDLDRIFATFQGLKLLILQDGSGIVSLPRSALPPSTRLSLRRLVLADYEYPPYTGAFDPVTGILRETEDGVDTLRLVGFRKLDKLPAGIWSAGSGNNISELFLAGLVVAKLLGTQDDLSRLEVLELRHCYDLPRAVVRRLVGLRHLVIRESPDLDLPQKLQDLKALTKLELCGHRFFSDAPTEQYGYTALPACVGALKGLQHLKLENLPSLATLPTTLSGLRELTCLEVLYCGLELSGAIGDLTALRSLTIQGCPNVTTLPSSIGNLEHLNELTLNDCDALTTISGSIRGLSNLTALRLQSCSGLEQLPDGVGVLRGLQVLDLSYCFSLRSLPASVRHLTSLTSASIQDSRSLLGAAPVLIEAKDLADLIKDHPHKLPVYAPWDWPLVKAGRALGWLTRKAWTPAELLRWVAETGTHKVVINKLTRQQDTMLTTLERLSWLVVLLATATFMAYIQPPGGINEKTNLVMATEEVLCSLTLPGWRSTGNITEQQMDFRQCAAFTFFVLDGLSFGFSLGCITVITLLSFPRLQYVSDDVEAGRFWLALLVTWLMFYLAVLTGFGAFLFSGLATYNQIWVVLMPTVPGLVIMLVAAWCFVFCFAEISPGWKPVLSYLWALVAGGAEKQSSINGGGASSLAEDDAYWVKLQQTLGAPPGAPNSTTALLGAAGPTPQGSPYMGATAPGRAQQVGGAGQPLQPFMKQLRGPGSSRVTRRSASAMAPMVTQSYGPGNPVPPAGQGGSRGGGGVPSSSGGRGASSSGSSSPDDTLPLRDQDARLQVITHPADVRDHRRWRRWQ